MSALLLAGVLLLFVIAALALGARGGASEPASTAPRKLLVTDIAELEDLTRRAISRMGLRIERVDPLESDGFGFLAVDSSPITGRRVYVRTIARTSGERAGAADIQAALDAAQDEGVNKLVLVSPTGFSDEAILSGQGTIAELLDGEALVTLAAREAPVDWKRTPSAI